MIGVGAELVSSEDRTEAWRDLIASVRDHYHGLVIYSFNWDHYSGADFYGDLDFVGISGYFSLPADLPLNPEGIAANWRDIRSRLLLFSREVGRPILFTEVGYPSVVGGARDPWNYLHEGPPDVEGQAAALSSFVLAWDGTDELAGVFFWNWSPVRGGLRDTSYSIRGKPARDIIRTWFSRFRIADPDGLR